jgi:hypothetical protein
MLKLETIRAAARVSSEDVLLGLQSSPRGRTPCRFVSPEVALVRIARADTQSCLSVSCTYTAVKITSLKVACMHCQLGAMRVHASDAFMLSLADECQLAYEDASAVVPEVDHVPS